MVGGLGVQCTKQIINLTHATYLLLRTIITKGFEFLVAVFRKYNMRVEQYHIQILY